jgi:hypothetical protein
MIDAIVADGGSSLYNQCIQLREKKDKKDKCKTTTPEALVCPACGEDAFESLVQLQGGFHDQADSIRKCY